jgi:ABC-type transporter Mla subunit MlaD
MFRFSYAAKVGLLLVVGVFLFIIVLDVMGYKIWSPKRTKGYYFSIIFETTKGLQEGYDVLYNGYWIGEVGQPRRYTFGEVEVPVRIAREDYKIHRNAYFLISRESIFGGYVLLISEDKGGILMDVGKEGENVARVKMPRGQAVRAAPVLYHYPGSEVVDRVGPGVLIGEVYDIEKSEEDPFTDIVRIKLLPDIDIELNEDHTFVPSRSTDERLVPTAGGYDTEEVITGRIDVYERIKEGDVVVGFREPGPEDLVASADKLVKSASDAIEKVSEGLTEVVLNVNMVLSEVGEELTGEGEGTIKGELVGAIEKLKASLANVELLTENLNKQLIDVKPSFDRIVADIENATDNVEGVTSEIHDFVSDPELLDSIKDAIKNLELATEDVVRAIREIEELVSDETLKQDIKALVGDARETIEDTSHTIREIQTAIDTFNRTETGGEFRFRYLTEPEAFASDFDFTIDPPKGRLFYRIGVDDIGEEDEFNLQLGMRAKGGWSGRFGLKRGAIGAGIDYDHGRFIMRGDVYDPNDVRFDLYGGYALSEDLRFIIGFEDLYDEDLFHFGIATTF